MSTSQLDFVAVGPFKTGTSWIYDYLADYQQIALPTKVKETFFFDRKFEQGIDWYFQHFTSLESRKIVGEIAPSYFSSPEATTRIHQLNPNCQILVTLREPVSRLKSFYLHMKQRGEINPKLTFLEALSQATSLIETSRYYFHLNRWINTFGPDQVKVIFFEELKKSPDDFATTLCKKLHLDLETTSKDLSQKVNSAQAPTNHYLAKAAYSGVTLLHDLGLHKLVDYGKNLGLKHLVFSRKGSKFELSPEEFAAAFKLIQQDVMQLETVLRLDLSEWKLIWQDQGILVQPSESTVGSKV